MFALAGCAILRGGTSGTEECSGCRLERDVLLRDGVTHVRSTTPSECTKWVLASVPDHEHAWERTGCWRSAHGIATYGAGLRLVGWHGDWLAYLRSLPPDELERTLLRVAGDDAENAEVQRLFRAWDDVHGPDLGHVLEALAPDQAPASGRTARSQ